MRVDEIMTRGVEFVSPTDTVQDAATRMAEYDIGAVLVGSADQIAGILTDRDIILRVVVAGRDPARVTTGEVASRRVFTCGSNDSPEAVLAMMREHQVRRLPVVDERGDVIGIVVRSDLYPAEPRLSEQAPVGAAANGRADRPGLQAQQG